MRRLAEIARAEALKCYHGFVSETEPNIMEFVKPFPRWSLKEADACWCAAFVYHCCCLAGFEIPIRPAGCISSNLAGCPAWEEWAQSDERLLCFREGKDYLPCAGDIVIFDRVFNGSEHDHIGVVLEVRTDGITTAEGNFNNVSAVVDRKRDEHIRCYIRIPEGYRYS